MMAPGRPDAPRRHAGWVRVSHTILAVAVLTLAFSGVAILMVHPRLYWGVAGNDLTPALVELPISRNFRHGGWTPPTPFFAGTGAPVTASRTYDIFNQNGWARSLHFLAAWWLVVPGVIYLVSGVADGHFRAHVWPRPRDLTGGRLTGDIADHLRLRLPPPAGGPSYGPLQKLAYASVIFVAAPLVIVTGLAMSPAITATWPLLGSLFGGYQSARTVHFAAFAMLLAFAVVHVAMVIVSGFVRQVKSITIGA